jgi:type IV conjugative transfer system protein TraL
MDKYYIPQKLDAPFKIAFFTMEELAVFIIPFMIIAFVFQKHMLALAVSLSLCFLLRKIKGEENQHFFKHFIYWHFPPLAFYKVTPPSYVREIIG